MYRKLLTAIIFSHLCATAAVWTVRLEEPTGIERRTGEIVRVPAANLGGHASGYRVADMQGREVPAEVRDGQLLFPASIMGGAVAEYRITCCQPRAAAIESQVAAGRLPSGRVELKNDRVRVVLDPRTGHIVEAYALHAGPQRMLNLVETTPDQRDPHDIQPPNSPAPQGPASPVPGPNTGWGPVHEIGEVAGIDIQPGVLSAVVRVRGKSSSWEIALDAESAVLRIKSDAGIRFASVSATPHMPFNRCVDGNEYLWPTGPGSGEPPDHEIGPRAWRRPPGGHFVYYHSDENYGALAIVPLSEGLDWTGACTSRFEGRTANPKGELAIVFPEWRGQETALAARSEARRLRNPLLLQVTANDQGELALNAPLPSVEPVTYADAAQSPTSWTPQSVDLDGEWELAWGEKGAGPTSEWRKVRVPGSVHLQWLPREQIYTQQAAWVSAKEWWYRRTLTVPGDWAGRRIHLEFGATDYYAEAFLDGHRLGRHEGYIDPYSYDITSRVKPGAPHQLLVRVWTPVHYYWKHRPYTVKGSYGGVDQKPDDITAAGITRSVRLLADRGTRVKDVAVATFLETNRATLAVSLESDGRVEGAEWRVNLSPRNFQGGKVLEARTASTGASARVEFKIDNPQLWWTWDQGRPNLYTLDARLVAADGTVLDARQMAIGLRTVTRVGDRFYLNGRPVFLRGTNVYANLWLSEMGRKEYERDLDVISKMNVNLIRLHCHFENPEFYELADERGLFIWQDFLEAWYPRDTEFSRHAAALFDNHIRMVRNHPSVMAWAPSDEEDLFNYADLSKHLAARAALLDPQDRWVQRSTGRYGDAHLYYGWYEGTIWEYARMDSPLVTELGATALPAKESLDRFLKDKWPITAHPDLWRYHRLQLPEAEGAWGDLSGTQSPEQLIGKSQRYAARLFQIALERARRNKAQGAGGIFHFFAIDFWPSITMAAVDFYRVPTLVHAQVARSFEPVLASIEFDRDTWKSGERVAVGLWGINDRHEAYPGAIIAWRIVDGKGTILRIGEFRQPMGPDTAAKAGTVEWEAGAPGAYTLHAEVRTGGKVLSRNHFEFAVAP